MSYSEPDVPVIPLLRLAAITIGCLIGGPFLLVRHYSNPEPVAFEKLQQVTGTVALETGTHTTRRSSATYPVLVINGQRYKYLHWFPGADNLPGRLRSGDSVSIWTDADDNQWVWQIEQGGETIVSYNAVRRAVAANRSWDPIFGGFLIILGIGAGVRLAFVTRPFWMTDKPQKRKSAPKAKKKPRRRPLKELDDE